MNTYYYWQIEQTLFVLKSKIVDNSNERIQLAKDYFDYDCTLLSARWPDFYKRMGR